MWAIVRLFSDCSTLDDVDVYCYETKETAVKELKSMLNEFVNDYCNGNIDKKDELRMKRSLELITKGQDERIVIGAHSWEIRFLRITKQN